MKKKQIPLNNKKVLMQKLYNQKINIFHKTNKIMMNKKKVQIRKENLMNKMMLLLYNK